jgi:hypothetical protein
VRRKLEAAISDLSVSRSHFEFNVFEVTIDKVNATVLLQDVLDATEVGKQMLTVGEFVVALGRCSG